MNIVKGKELQTHVECLVWDPFPTIDKCRYDSCSREAIVAACIEKYKAWPDMLVAITIYDISVVIIDGIKYKSDPLNKQTWSKEK